MSAVGFGLHFCGRIRLLYTPPGIMVEVNPSLWLARFVRVARCYRCCTLLRLSLSCANPALRGLTLSGSCEVARYTAYADDVSVLVMSSTEVIEVSKEIGRLVSWKSCALLSPFIWREGPCKILGVWFGPDLQLEKNWSEVLEKVVSVTELWLCRELGWGVRLTHRLPGRLPIFSASNPVHHPIQVWKVPIPVYLGETGSFGATGDLSLSPVWRRSRCAKCRDAAP